jgi:hypothetical protein
VDVLIAKSIWLFTSGLVGIIGWFILRGISRIESDIKCNTDDIKKNDDRINNNTVRLSVIETILEIKNQGK